jgi:hypothetical protein
MWRSIVLIGGLAVYLISAADASDITAGWKRQIAPHAAQWAFSYTPERALRFEVRDGDCSDDRKTPECATGRERAELVDRFEPRPGMDLWYGYSLLVPKATPELPVHITIGQWWSPTLVFAIRETAGRLDFAIYASGNAPPLHRVAIAPALAARGTWNRIVVHAAYAAGGQALIEAHVNGTPICTWRGPIAAANGRLPIWKLGLYRPNMRDIPRPHPTQVVFVKDPRRGTTRQAVE